MISKKTRISRELFKQVLAKGKNYPGFGFSLKVLSLPTGPARLAVVVSKRTVGRATARNLARRRFYEAGRLLFSRIVSKTAVVLFLTEKVQPAGFVDLKDKLFLALDRAGLIAGQSDGQKRQKIEPFSRLI
jgi:ribonuclease P protein component